MIILRTIYNGKCIHLCNIHAPNEEKEKYKFYNEMERLMEDKENVYFRSLQ